MNTPVTFEQLDQLTSDVLPDRTVMSVLVTPVGGGGAVSDSGGGGATMMSTCTTTTTYHEPGLLGVLGLGINNVPVTTTTCTPSAIATS